MRLAHHSIHALAPLRLPVLERPAGDVARVHHAHHVVEFSTHHRDAAEAGPQPQRQRLPQGLRALDPDHLGARYHHLSHEVSPSSNTECSICRSSSSITKVSPGLVEQFPQFRLAGEQGLGSPCQAWWPFPIRINREASGPRRAGESAPVLGPQVPPIQGAAGPGCAAPRR